MEIVHDFTHKMRLPNAKENIPQISTARQQEQKPKNQ